mmetsp:Transcript_13474/g.30582  ORF Transcript_13474/g.30582 Transcript_13474/m.30582 type:complete len:270 (-) Transcript_13474:32-841(-)
MSNGAEVIARHPPWQICQCPTGTYYYNETTGESTWQMPAALANVEKSAGTALAAPGTPQPAGLSQLAAPGTPQPTHLAAPGTPQQGGMNPLAAPGTPQPAGLGSFPQLGAAGLQGGLPSATGLGLLGAGGLSGLPGATGLPGSTLGSSGLPGAAGGLPGLQPLPGQTLPAGLEATPQPTPEQIQQQQDLQQQQAAYLLYYQQMAVVLQQQQELAQQAMIQQMQQALVAQQGQTSTTGPRTRDANGKELCRQFMRGNCSYGDNCRYSHDK